MIGEELMPYVQAVVVFFASVIVAKALLFIMNIGISKVAARTKTSADDRFLRQTKKPFFMLILLIGLNLALKFVPETVPYQSSIDLGFNIILIMIGACIAVDVFDLLFALYIEKIMPFVIGNERESQITPILRNITKILIYCLAVILILSRLGYDITPMLAGLGIAGLAVAFALQSTLSGFFAGFYMLADKPIRRGDYIALSTGEQGYVESIGWRSTRIRALQNYIIVVPNSKLVESIIYNYALPQDEMAVIVPVGVAYGSDLDKVERVTVDAATKVQKSTPGAVKEFKPFIRYNKFDSSSINFSVILRAQSYVDKYLILHEFIKQLVRYYKKEKITIPLPQQDVYVKQFSGLALKPAVQGGKLDLSR